MGNKKPKTIEVVLKKANVTLDEVLDVETVMGKAKTGDTHLLEFLGTTANVHGLFQRIVRSYSSHEKAIRYTDDPATGDAEY